MNDIVGNSKIRLTALEKKSEANLKRN